MSERARSSRKHSEEAPPLKGRQRLSKSSTQQLQTQPAPQPRSMQPAPAPVRPPESSSRLTSRTESLGDASYGPRNVRRVSETAALPVSHHIHQGVASQQARRAQPAARQQESARHTGYPPSTAVDPRRATARAVALPQPSLSRITGTFSPQYMGLLAVALTSILVIFMLVRPNALPTMSTMVAARAPAANSLSAAAVPVEGGLLPLMPTPDGQHTLLGRSSLTPEQIDAVLAEYGSPAQGTGRVWVEIGNRFNLNAAYALAFFVHESGAGTAQNWAGLKPDGSTTHNVGNIICAGYATCYGRFRDYNSWERGIEDWYELIAYEYVQGRNIHTLEDIIPIYAPSFENDVPQYVNVVASLIKKWGEL